MSFLKRIEKVQNFLISNEYDFFIAEDEVTLFYLTGLRLEGKLIIGKNISRLFVDKRYLEEVERKSPCKVFLLKEDLISDMFLLHSEGGKIIFDGKYFNFESYERLEKFIKKLQKQANKEISFELISKENTLKEIRAIKSQDEISSLRKAAMLAWKGFEHICSLLKEGISEETLALEFKLFCYKNKAERLSFDPIICFGKNSAIPHHVSDQTLLKKDDIILIDIGVVVEGYCSDMTRVIFFGSQDPLLEKIYSIVKKAHRKALSFCKPGVTVQELDMSARKFIKEEGYKEEFVHGLGHGVGIEVHEFPIVKKDSEDKDVVLKPGMVITIEPGIYKENVGGVRYEDTILITKDGYENFYTSY